MLIKSMARKSASFGQLIQYIDAPSLDNQAGPALVQNLLTSSLDRGALHGEFLGNARLLPPRKNGNVLFHEVLAFASSDREQVTPAILEDLTRRWLELRAPYALAYARAHFDRVHPHVHLMISANNVGSPKRLRLSKAQFRRAQLELERYQRDRYPQLRHSLAQQPRQPDRLRETRNEQERRRRFSKTGRNTRKTQKEQLRALVTSELQRAESGADCYRSLLSKGVRLYRRGKTVGVEQVEGGRRYRLRTLGLAQRFEQVFAEWRRLPERLRLLKSDRERQKTPRGRERGEEPLAPTR